MWNIPFPNSGAVNNALAGAGDSMSGDRGSFVHDPINASEMLCKLS